MADRDKVRAIGRVTEDNPAGVQSFDHTEAARLPEYHRAQAALDALVHAMSAQDESPLGGQPAWLVAVQDMTAAVAFGDNCSGPRRGTTGHTGDGLDLLAYPVAMDLDGRGNATASYACQVCGYRWTTGWGLMAPGLF